jgi:hypothetical protein
MIGGCLFSTRYSMTAEVYRKDRITTKSGQVKSVWVLDTSVGSAGVIDCIVMPFLSESFTRQGTGEEFGSKYLSVEFLKMSSAINIPRSAQVANIRNKADGVLIYKDVEFGAAPGTWYNSSGTAPVIGPFGEIVDYQTLLSRAETQGGV